jgi:hypothetical protein
MGGRRARPRAACVDRHTETRQAHQAEEAIGDGGTTACDGRRLAAQVRSECPNEACTRDAGTHIEGAGLSPGLGARTLCARLELEDGSGMCVHSGCSSRLALCCDSRILCSVRMFADGTPSRKHLMATPGTRAPAAGATTAHDRRTSASSHEPDAKRPV